MIQRPSAIAERHLQRRAIAYPRQSTEQQVREAVGSTALQRDMTIRLANWGWPNELIELLEDDLGVSGSNPGGRAGFSRLLARMKAGEIGLVAVTQDTRLSRNLLDFAGFADVARRFDVLLAYGEQVIDFQDPNSEFIATILGSNAARESRVRVELSQQARRKKAEVGIAPTGPPVGYVRTRTGAWLKDPDARVGEVIQLVFDKFLEVGSVRGLVRYFRQHQIQLPRKPRRGHKPWVDATYSNILRLLRHPAYSGMYVYSRTTIDERLDRYPNGKHRTRPVPPGQWIRVPDHHEPYVSATRWAEIQERMRENRRTLSAPPGRGPTLVQGRLHCAVHRTLFVTTYPTRHTEPNGRVIRMGQYSCRPEQQACGSAQHASVMAHRLDSVIEMEVLQSLAPPSLELIRHAAREALREYDALDRGRADELRRLEATVAATERAFDQSEPDQTYLRRRLAEKLDCALRELNDRKAFFQLHPVAAPLTLSDGELSELQVLLADLPSIWRHQLVSNEQRKALVRIVIRRVDATPGPAAWTLAITWAGGASTSHTLLTGTGERAQLTDAFAVIRSRFADGASAPQITQELNEAQIGQERGPWTERKVRHIITLLQRGVIEGFSPLPPRRGIAARIRALYEAGLTAKQILSRLGEEGALTLRNRPVPIQHVHTVLRRVRARRASHRLNPVESPPKTRRGAEADAARTPTGEAMAHDLLVFTARYSNPNIVGSALIPVGITRYPPRFRLAFELTGNLYDLAPTVEMLQIAKGENGRERFTAAYRARLDAIGVREIVRQLTAARGANSGLVLLCYEDVTTGEHWCHRLLLGEWLREHAGLVVSELPDPGKKASRRKATPDP